MPLPRKAVLGILSDNLRIRKTALPLSRKALTGWARGLDIPWGGETILYTGHLYQLIPAISAMAQMMTALENSPLTRMMGLGRLVNKFISISGFMARSRKEDQAACDRTLRSIALLLSQAGIEYGYLYDKELYSGALAYDQGIDGVFLQHARRVRNLFSAHGVKRVITVDPHTTNMLRHVYPELLKTFNVKVCSWLEVLAGKQLEPKQRLEGRVTVHDSCVYARYEGVVDQPRRLLNHSGLSVEQPELSGLLTHCCGGPIESLFPALAHDIAGKRAEQLTASGSQVATMCPICLVNLKGAINGDGPACRDIADILAEAYL